jgi:hypothetical protein
MVIRAVRWATRARGADYSASSPPDPAKLPSRED